MNRSSGYDDKDLDRLFSGIGSEGPLDDVTAFLRGIRASCAQSPSQDVVDRHVASISEAIRDIRSEPRSLVDRRFMTARASLWRRAVNKILSAALKVGAGVVATSMSMIGLAYAGVDLPQQAAANAIENVTGLELPNQDPETGGGVRVDRSVSEDVRAVIESRDSFASGCEFGRAVAAAASQNSQGQGDPEANDCQSDGEAAVRRGGAARDATKSSQGGPKGADGSENAARGRSNATEKSRGASAAGSGNAARGRSKASERSQGASDARPGTPPGRLRVTGGGDPRAGTGKPTASETPRNDQPPRP